MASAGLGYGENKFGQELILKVQGLDAFDGSPVLDIKPVFVEFTPDRAAIRQPKWSHELMAEYF
jgi:tRNA (Thr-GGU) A37 N-methylase